MVGHVNDSVNETIITNRTLTDREQDEAFKYLYKKYGPASGNDRHYPEIPWTPAQLDTVCWYCSDTQFKTIWGKTYMVNKAHNHSPFAKFLYWLGFKGDNMIVR